MERMIRKQIYIRKRQEQLLKRQAKQRGISEAELIRQALELQLTHGSANTPIRSDQDAWERAYKFMQALHAQGPVPNQRRTWKREDAYEDRMSRHERRPD